jgi:hypothetical protein
MKQLILLEFNQSEEILKMFELNLNKGEQANKSEQVG